MNNMTPREIKALLDGQEKMQEYLSNFNVKGEDAIDHLPVGNSALDYIRSVEGKEGKTQEATDPTVNLNLSAPASVSPSSIDIRESWQRIVIGDGIELNLKLPIHSEDKARIDELIAFTRRLFRNIKNGENINGNAGPNQNVIMNIQADKNVVAWSAFNSYHRDKHYATTKCKHQRTSIVVLELVLDRSGSMGGEN